MESVCTGNRTKGSNPFLSASLFDQIPLSNLEFFERRVLATMLYVNIDHSSVASALLPE